MTDQEISDYLDEVILRDPKITPIALISLMEMYREDAILISRVAGTSEEELVEWNKGFTSDIKRAVEELERRQEIADGVESV